MKFPCVILLVAIAANHPAAVEGFTISSPSKKVNSALNFWVDDHPIPPRTPSSVSKTNKKVNDLETRARTCLESSNDVRYMNKLVESLEQVQYDCSEECNQTNDECDVTLKDERDVLINKLQEKINDVIASTMAVMFMTTTATASDSIEDQVKSCLNGQAGEFTTDQMKVLVQRLEDMNSDCTEEGNQTNDECDIVVKAERDYLIKQLELKIDDMESSVDALMTEISKQLASENKKASSLSQLTNWLQQLEKQNNLCTEEGNQTNEECDILIKDEREQLMELLATRISEQQTTTAQNTKNCTKYKLCDTSSMKKTLEELETLNFMCSEEGNQTRSFCDVEKWDERQEIMEALRHELELAKNVKHPPMGAADRSVFQI